MNETDIRKLIACRQAITDCKTEKTEARMAAKGILSGKSDDKEYLELQKQLTEAIEKRDATLRMYGFNFINDFFVFNEKMCLGLVKELRTMHGECDDCKGYEGTPPCRTLFNEYSCQGLTEEEWREKTKMDDATREKYYGWILEGMRFGIKVTKAQREAGGGIDLPSQVQPIRQTKAYFDPINKTLRLACPPGHGYYHDCSVPQEDFPFPVRWIP